MAKEIKTARGQPSQSIAGALRDWLPTVVQHVEPWMSGEEIKSGTASLGWQDRRGARVHALHTLNLATMII